MTHPPAQDRRAGIWFDRQTRWVAEMALLRRMLLAGGLHETFKWRKPCYMWGDGNVAMLPALRDTVGISFFKGDAMQDPQGLLVPVGPNARAARKITFTSTEQITAATGRIAALIADAIAVEAAGTSITFAKDDLEMPAEMADVLAEDPDLSAAFEALTPGRRRGYFLHVGGAKAPATRRARVLRARDRILAGKGFNER